MDGEFLEIKRSEFELDPNSNSVQPSIWSITHRVLFFGVGKYALNCLRTQSIGLFANRGVPDIFCLFNIIMPDMSGYGLYTLLILSTLFSDWAILADISFALIFPVAFTIRRCITQHLILRTEYTIVVLVVYVFVIDRLYGRDGRRPLSMICLQIHGVLYPASAVTTSISG